MIAFEEAKTASEVSKEWKRASKILKKRAKRGSGIRLSKIQDMRVVTEHPITSTEWIMNP